MYKFIVKSEYSNRNEPIIIQNTQVKSCYGKLIINLGYGYEYYWGNWCKEGHDSALPGNRYRIMHNWQPHEGDIITHLKSGRVFTVGEVTGFILYEAPLIENGRIVAILKFEDYYKD